MPKIIDEPREAILLHAKNIIINEGYEQLTIRRVAKDAGIAVGTVYNYFPTKRDLTVQLLEDYWYSYLVVVDEIDASNLDFYEKLKKLYIELERSVKTFREVWIKNSSVGYHDEDMVKKKNFIEKLNKRLEDILLDAQENGFISLSADSFPTAKFLVQNFFMMSMMNQFDYDSFEAIIKKLFQ